MTNGLMFSVGCPPSISLRDAAHGLTVCLTPPYNNLDNLDNLGKGVPGLYD